MIEIRTNTDEVGQVMFDQLQNNPKHIPVSFTVGDAVDPTTANPSNPIEAPQTVVLVYDGE